MTKTPEFWLFAPIWICADRPTDPPQPAWVLAEVPRRIGTYRPIKLRVIILDASGEPRELLIRRDKIKPRT